MVSRARCHWLIASLIVLCVPASAARAQSDGWTNEVAKRLFEEGVRLGSIERWPDALARFRQSERLVPRASTSYNIANALYRLDRPTEALEELERSEYLVDPADAALQERRAELRVLARAEVAEIRLRLKPPDAVLFADGILVPGESSLRSLRFDPGRHALRLTKDGYAPHEEILVLRPGARIDKSVVLEPVHEAAPIPPMAPTQLSSVGQAPPPGQPSEQRRFVKSPGFWVLIGVVAAAGIGAGVAIAVTRNDDSPECGTTGACAAAPTRAAFSF